MMALSLGTGYERSYTSSAPQRANSLSCLKANENFTLRHPPRMSSPRTAIPLKDYGHTALQNEMHSSNVDPSVTSSPSATPPQNSLGRLVSSDLTRYMALFEECVRARKNRRAYNFLPSEEQERVSMSFNDFWKLDQILGGTETDFRYVFIPSKDQRSY